MARTASYARAAARYCPLRMSRFPSSTVPTQSECAARPAADPLSPALAAANAV